MKNLKVLFDNLQAKTTYFQTQVEKLQIEKKELIISNLKLLVVSFLFVAFLLEFESKLF